MPNIILTHRVALLRWFLDRWRQRQRSIDLQILWPECKRHAEDLDHARAAFTIHALNDPAWRCLGQEQLDRAINELH